MSTQCYENSLCLGSVEAVLFFTTFFIPLELTSRLFNLLKMCANLINTKKAFKKLFLLYSETFRNLLFWGSVALIKKFVSRKYAAGTGNLLVTHRTKCEGK